ncbi:uncharacterized protein [Ptychodera flava]|uniref:uncharacterized protein n=1 Tax=Ptychodera flava TaxID=63121 RepID=UPI003969FF74
MVQPNEDVNSDSSTQQINSTIDIDSSDSSDSDEKDFTDSKERVHTESMNNINCSTHEDRRNGDNHACGEISHDDTAEDYSQSKGLLPDSPETKPVSTIKTGNRTTLRRQVSIKHCPSISSHSSAKSDEGDGQPHTDMDDTFSANVEPGLQSEKECQERVTILPRGENNNSSTDTKETQKSSEDVSYNFHQTCGPNVDMVWRTKGAKRKRKAKTFDGGTVMTETPLKDDVVFQIVIEPTESDQARRINIGATSNNPDKLKSIPDMRKPQEGDAVNILWSNRNVYAGGKYQKSLSEDIDECTVGDTVGIKKTKSSLKFYLNGEEVGNLDKGKCDWNNKALYGVVDLYGKGSHVSITKNNYTQEKAVNFEFLENFPVVESYARNKKRVKPVMEQMRKVIIAFKRHQKDVKRFPCNAASLVNIYILKPASSVKSENLRQLGDHLARLGAATEFKKLLQYLFSNNKIKDGKKTQDYLSGREIVLETCRVYSKASRELKVSFGESGLLELLITQIMESNEGDSNEGAASNSNEDHEQVISHLHDVLKKSIKGTKLYDIDTINIEVTKTLGFLASKKENATTIMDKGSVQLLLSLIKRGELAERETAAFALLQLSRHDYEDHQKNHFLPVPKNWTKCSRNTRKFLQL